MDSSEKVEEDPVIGDGRPGKVAVPCPVCDRGEADLLYDAWVESEDPAEL